MTDEPVRRCKARGGHPMPALPGSDFCRLHAGGPRRPDLTTPITEDHGPVIPPVDVLDRLIAETEDRLERLRKLRAVRARAGVLDHIMEAATEENKP